MGISLWIVKNQLKEFNPFIIEGKTYNSKSPLEDLICIDRATLYRKEDSPQNNIMQVGYSNDFFSDGKKTVTARFWDAYLTFDTEDLALIFNSIMQTLELFKKWESHLNEELAHQSTITGLLANSTEIMECPIIVLDTSDSLIAFSPRYQASHIDESWDMLMQNSASSFEQILSFHDSSNGIYDKNWKDIFYIPAGIYQRGNYSKNLYCNHQFCGICAAIEYPTPLNTGELHAFWLLCHFIEDWFSYQESFDEFGQNAKLLTGESASSTLDALERKLSVKGWFDNDEKLLVIARPTSANHHTQRYLSNMFADHSPWIFAGATDNSLLLLINITHLPEKSFKTYLARTINESVYYCGISQSFTSLVSLENAHRQCDIALSYGNKSSGALNKSEDYHINMIVSILSENLGDYPLYPSLKLLSEYDAKHNTQLYNTLLCFLQNERSSVSTSKQLYIHRNTLSQRLQKIHDLTMIDLDNPNNRLLIQLEGLISRFNEKRNQPYS